MTAEHTVPTDPVATTERLTEVTLRPRFEHASARMRLGVRGLTSLAEEGLVNWFRVRGISPLVLAERFGLELTIVDCSSLCGGVVSLDDQVVAGVHPVGVRHFNVQLSVRDGDEERVPMRSRVTAVLVRRPGVFEDHPEEVTGMVVDGLEAVRAAVPGHDHDREAGEAAGRLAGGTPGWHRSWRVPMADCHHAGRMQHAAHLRVLTELAEVFAEDHDLPARELLEERGLVVAMPRVRVRLLADAHVGEVLHVRYEVQQVVGGSLLDCRYDAHVERGGRLVRVALGTLLQGFVRVDDPAGSAVALTGDMVERMTSERPVHTG